MLKSYHIYIYTYISIVGVATKLLDIFIKMLYDSINNYKEVYYG